MSFEGAAKREVVNILLSWETRYCNCYPLYLWYESYSDLHLHCNTAIEFLSKLAQGKEWFYFIKQLVVKIKSWEAKVYTQVGFSSESSGCCQFITSVAVFQFGLRPAISDLEVKWPHWSTKPGPMSSAGGLATMLLFEEIVADIQLSRHLQLSSASLWVISPTMNLLYKKLWLLPFFWCLQSS